MVTYFETFVDGVKYEFSTHRMNTGNYEAQACTVEPREYIVCEWGSSEERAILELVKKLEKLKKK